jgi:hypothetical protein
MAKRQMHPNSLANLKMFTTDYQPKNPGRKPSKLKKYMKDNQVSDEDIRRIIRNFIACDYTVRDLFIIANDPKQPAFITALARTLYFNIEDGEFGEWWEALRRVVAMPTESVEHSGSLEQKISTITRQEAQEKLDEYVRKRLQEKPELKEEISGEQEG